MTELNLIEPLFSEEVVSEQILGIPDIDDLLPEEMHHVARAVEKRRREFAGGRLCARKALSRCGVNGFPLHVGPSRAPVWPSGFVGSITHTDGFCGAVVARCGRIMGLGLDAEPSRTLLPDLWSSILVPSEIEALSRFTKREQGIRSRLIFSAKESVYKCLQTPGPVPLGFHDVEILVDPDSSTFSVVWRKPDPPDEAGGQLKGRFRIHPEWILTGISWEGPGL